MPSARKSPAMGACFARTFRICGLFSAWRQKTELRRGRVEATMPACRGGTPYGERESAAMRQPDVFVRHGESDGPFFLAKAGRKIRKRAVPHRSLERRPAQAGEKAGRSVPPFVCKAGQGIFRVRTSGTRRRKSGRYVQPSCRTGAGLAAMPPGGRTIFRTKRFFRIVFIRYLDDTGRYRSRQVQEFPICGGNVAGKIILKWNFEMRRAKQADCYRKNRIIYCNILFF